MFWFIVNVFVFGRAGAREGRHFGIFKSTRRFEKVD